VAIKLKQMSKREAKQEPMGDTELGGGLLRGFVHWRC
jgi:hypothetical protein